MGCCSGAITRSGIGPAGPSISSHRASGTNTGLGKIPRPSRRARRVSSGGIVLTGGIVAISRSSSALKARVCSSSSGELPVVTRASHLSRHVDAGLLELALGRDPDDVPGQADALHAGDQQARRVDLRLLEAVERGTRKSVVIVVPGLAERQQRQPGHVRRLVLDVEAAAAEEVAHRVHRPGHVVHEEDPYEAAPDVPAQRTLPGEAAEDVACNRWNQQRDQHEPRKALADARIRGSS